MVTITPHDAVCTSIAGGSQYSSPLRKLVVVTYKCGVHSSTSSPLNSLSDYTGCVLPDLPLINSENRVSFGNTENHLQTKDVALMKCHYKHEFDLIFNFGAEMAQNNYTVGESSGHIVHKVQNGTGA